MFSSVAALFRTEAAEEVELALADCNRVFANDFGPGHTLSPKFMPDLLMMAKDDGDRVVGVVTLHRAQHTWEIGPVSVETPYNRNDVLVHVIPEAVSALSGWYTAHGDVSQAWLVHKIGINRNPSTHIDLRFHQRPLYPIGSWIDDGYIPFKPFSEKLMCRPVFEEK